MTRHVVTGLTGEDGVADLTVFGDSNTAVTYDVDIQAPAGSDYDCTDRCIAEFGEPTYRCVMPDNDITKSGCILPPSYNFV